MTEGTEGTDKSAEGEEEEEEVSADEVLEPWLEWKRRATHQVLSALEKLRLPDWVEEQRKHYWAWAGHTARRKDGRWSAKLLCWTPLARRPPGRPCLRWEDRLSQYDQKRGPGENWLKDAQNRESWAASCRDFVLSF